MTLDETRDALAAMDGWNYEPPADHREDPAWWRWNTHPTLKSRTWCKNHPHPPTLDGADAAVPEGFVWNRRANRKGVPVWVAWHVHDDADVPLVEVRDTGDKIANLYALALACRKAMEEKR